MKIVSWNCHYGLTKEKYEHLLKAENQLFANADIYVFQEVLENEFINISDYPESYNYKYRHWYGDHHEFGKAKSPRIDSGDLGIIILSKDYRIKRLDQGLIRFRYVVPYIVESKNECFILLHVWTKGKPIGYIYPIYETLKFYSSELNKNIPIVMIGDFNFGKTFDDSFFSSFKKRINNLTPGLNMLPIISDNRRTFYYPEYPEKEYFNDCVFAKNCKGKFLIGEANIWIQAMGAESDYSDHCPILAEIDLIK